MGAALTSDGSKESLKQSATVVSDTNDVISCKEERSASCAVDTSIGFNQQLHCYCLSPEEYIKRAGYAKLLKVGTQFYNGSIYLLLEVSK